MPEGAHPAGRALPGLVGPVPAYPDRDGGSDGLARVDRAPVAGPHPVLHSRGGGGGGAGAGGRGRARGRGAAAGGSASVGASAAMVLPGERASAVSALRDEASEAREAAPTAGGASAAASGATCGGGVAAPGENG